MNAQSTKRSQQFRGVDPAFNCTLLFNFEVNVLSVDVGASD